MQPLSDPSVSKAASNGSRAGSPARLAVSPEAAGVLPVEFIKHHRVLPLKVGGGVIVIATAEPGNHRVIDDIRLLTGLEVEEQVVDSAELLEKIAESCQVTVEQMVENLQPDRTASAVGKN